MRYDGWFYICRYGIWMGLVGNVHAMSHPVSAYFHVPHGVANAVILPTVVEYNALAGTDVMKSFTTTSAKTKNL